MENFNHSFKSVRSNGTNISTESSYISFKLEKIPISPWKDEVGSSNSKGLNAKHKPFMSNVSSTWYYLIDANRELDQFGEVNYPHDSINSEIQQNKWR